MKGSARRIWMVGMMGSGKSTVGAVLAERLGWDLIDTDALIEEGAGRRISDLWQDQGEAAFRAREAQAIEDVAGMSGPQVVSVGGGAVLDATNRARMSQSGLVVWLRADVRTLAARIGTGETRPALGGDPDTTLARVDESRRVHYEDVADLVVDVDDVDPGQAATTIIESAKGATSRA